MPIELSDNWDSWDRVGDVIVIPELKNCARCGETHDGSLLTFSKLTNPIEDPDGTKWTHWSPCPINGEPILLRAQLVEE